MDIYSFVNSKDIREHLRKIKYSFNSLETAWLIYSCHNLSFEQRKIAWTELIETMPDCEVPSRINCIGWNSLYEMLQQYMDAVEGIVSDFYEDTAPGNYVYMYSYMYQGDKGWTEEYETIYGSLGACLNAYKEDVKDLDETYSPDSTGVVKYRLKKQSLIDTKVKCELEYKGNGQFDRIVYSEPMGKEMKEILAYSFEGLWFDIPTPFKAGDIVWVPAMDEQIEWHCDGSFVLKGLSTWDSSENIASGGDNSDMNGYGYFVSSKGMVYYEVMHNYMDLEYYNGPYKINEKILPALSKFVKGEIEVDLLLCAYHKVMMDVASDEIKLKSWYSGKIIEEMGLGSLCLRDSIPT